MGIELAESQNTSHGGRRRKHVAPLLLPSQVEAIRLARAAATPFKELERTYRCSRKTLYRATYGQGPYAGYADNSTTRIQALIDDAARWRAYVLIKERE